MSDHATNIEDLGFAPEVLRAKCELERDKRLRPEGSEQYNQVVGDFSHCIDDPYVDEAMSREPLNDEVDVVIIGGGSGGTWYWNRYPGAACDTESYIYLPLLEELNFIPKEKYTHAPEILAHCHNIATKFDLYDRACLQTEVTALEWDAPTSRWTVRTNRGDAMRARFVVMSNGPLNRPKLPGINGINDFSGHTFHTSRWDYAYSGGNSEGDLHNLTDKRVTVIGTGATTVQCVPHVGASAKELYVFQRTPSSIDVRANLPTDPEWAASLEPGWQRERMENFNILCSGGVVEEDLVKDGWTEIIRNLISMANYRGKNTNWHEVPELMELADIQKMEQIRARAEEIVQDPVTAEALKPYYRQFCKRPCFHDYYLHTFNRSNVQLVDTDGHGVEEIAVSRFNEDFLVTCTPGYYNNEGQPNPKSIQNGPYGKGSRPYFRITEAWRDEGTMQGLGCNE